MVDPPKKKRPDAIMAIIDSLNASPLIDSLGGRKVLKIDPSRPEWDETGLLGQYTRTFDLGPEINPNADFSAANPAVPSKGHDPRMTMIHESGHELYGKDKTKFPRWNEVAKGLPSFRTSPSADGGRGFTQPYAKDGSKLGPAFDVGRGRKLDGFTLADLLPWTKPGEEMTPYEKGSYGQLDDYYMGANITPKPGEQATSKPNEQFAQAFTNAFSFLSETAKNPGDYRRRIGDLEAATPGMGQVVLDILKTMPQFANHPLRAAFGVK